MMNYPFFRQRRGFTLIELFIVVAIISFIAAIIVPAFLTARDNARKARMGSQESAVRSGRTAPVALLSPKRAEMAALKPPVINSANIQMQLSASHHRMAMDVYTRFELIYRGRFLLAGNENAADPVRFDVQFPQGTTEARDVVMRFSQGDRQWEPQGVIYDQRGVFWAGVIPDKEPVTAEVTFIALGRDCFEYSLPPSSRLCSVDISLAMNRVTAALIPDQALQPTAVTAQNFEWKFSNLVTNRAIIIDLPAAQSPLWRLMYLCKLVGLAVLLFGAGFWYLVELYESGRLKGFRLGHFLLLALTYSLFFVIFAVLGFHGQLSTWQSMAVAAVLSMPLLVLHVSRIIDFRFAMTRTLPLAVFTLFLVINGVYGGDMRDYVFIAAAFITIAFVTVTYRAFSQKQEALAKSRDEELKFLVDALSPLAAEGMKVQVAARQLLKTSRSEISAEARSLIEKAAEAAEKAMADYNNLLVRVASVESLEPGDRKEFMSGLYSSALQLTEQLPRTTTVLHDAQAALLEAWKDQEQTRLEVEKVRAESHKDSAGKKHCTACGYPLDSFRFCPQCGVESALALNCLQCGETFHLPVQLIEKNRLEGLHCIKCGERLESS